MRAIIIVDGIPEDTAFAERYSTALLPLVDRPFLEYMIEYLIESGVRQFDFLIRHLPEQIEEALGDGRRWGSRFRFFRAADRKGLYALLPKQAEDAAPVLVAHADRLPHIELSMIAAQSEERSAPVLLRSESHWLGWAVVPSELLAETTLVTDEGTLEMWLRSRPRHTSIDVVEYLDVGSFAGLLAAQRRVVQGEFPALPETTSLFFACPQVLETNEDQIQVGQGAVVHPTARLIGPVYVGENSQIGEGACVGPNAVISANVRIGDRTTIKDALLLPATRVGEGMELVNVIADPARLYPARQQTRASVTDQQLLTEALRRQALHQTSPIPGRLAAIALLLFLWPLLILTALAVGIRRRGKVLHSHRQLVLPTTLDPGEWREEIFFTFAPDDKKLSRPGHLFLHLLPGLIAVALGKLRFVGIRPRSCEEVMALPMDYRCLYVRSSPGLIHDIPVRENGDGPGGEEQRRAEAIYTARASVRTDLGACWRYMCGWVR